MPSFPTASFSSHWRQLRWVTKVICILVGYALYTYLVKKAFAYLNATPPAPTPIAKKVAWSELQNYLETSGIPPLADLGMSLETLALVGIKKPKDLAYLGFTIFNRDLVNFETTTNELTIKNTREDLILNDTIMGIAHDIGYFTNRFECICNEETDISSIPYSPLTLDMSSNMSAIESSIDSLKTKCFFSFYVCQETLEENLAILKQLVAQLIEIDRMRKTNWLIDYLNQPDLLRFWEKQEPNVQARSLANCHATQTCHPKDLFALKNKIR